MSSIRTKIKVGLVSALSIAAIGSTVALAGGAQAATTNRPAPLPRACAVHTRASDNLQLTFNNQQFNYQVRLRITPLFQFHQRGVLLVSGTLCDLNEPVPLVLPVHGLIFGHGVVVLSVSYPTVGPDAGNQGVRTFVGVIGPHGSVTGMWSETGSEAGAGPFTLARI